MPTPTERRLVSVRLGVGIPANSANLSLAWVSLYGASVDLGRVLAELMPSFEARRFEELILYIAERTEGDPSFGHTKLAKTLFFCDFEAYRLQGAPITGAKYENWEHGPYPPALKHAVERLEDENRVHVLPPEQEFETIRFVATSRAPADLASVGVSAAQMELIDRCIERVSRLSAKALKALTHKLPGYMLTQRNETIPYDSAFLATRKPSDKEVAEARRIAEENGWLVGNEWGR